MVKVGGLGHGFLEMICINRGPSCFLWLMRIMVNDQQVLKVSALLFNFTLTINLP